MSTTKLTRLSMLTGIALILYYVESLLPPFIPVPGIKLGLANIVTLLLLEFYSCKEALVVLLVRILIVSLLFGQALSFLYSLCGGLFCLAILLLLKALPGKRPPLLLGMFSGLFHNLGQLVIALYVTRVMGIVSYLPYLVIFGILTGCLTGFISSLLLPYLKKIFID